MPRDRERNNPDIEREGMGQPIGDEPIGRANEEDEPFDDVDDSDENEDEDETDEGDID